MNIVDERYVDAFGVERFVPQSTRDAFAALLHIGTEPPIVAPAMVVRTDEPPAFIITLPATSWTQRVAWSLALESGTVIRGAAQLCDAEVVDSFEHGGQRFDRRRIALAELPLGYHRLEVDAGPYGVAQGAFIVVPTAAYLAPGDRTWGLAVQLYTLRSARNWGIGDFTDLAAFVKIAAAAGASYVGLNPLHAPHRSNPNAASPYAPTSRRFLNWLYIDITELPEAADPSVRAALAEPSLLASLAALRAKTIVDYAGVARVKDALLRRCFAVAAGAEDFQRFMRDGGVALERFAIFETLVERFGSDVAGWPSNYHDPQSDDVATFAQAERPALNFAKYLQFHAGRQLDAAAGGARALGLGLYRDLAVGVDVNGADAWIDAHAYVPSVSVGAPPDLLNPDGQDWGLPPLNPNRLATDAYRTIAELFRANMQVQGALRIDHVMSLARLFWSPRGRSATEGTYVAYPLEDLLGVLALESVRAQCTIVGEDLGTVPIGFRERMQAANVLSYRILFFERKADGGFIEAEYYPALSLAATGTHDLANFAAWLSGADIDLRASLGVGDPTRVPQEHADRETDRQRLLSSLRQAGDLGPQDAAVDDVLVAAHRFLARSPARIVMIQVDDALGEVLPINVPGTYEEYPNWRRKLNTDLDTLAHDERFARVCSALRELRPQRAPDV